MKKLFTTLLAGALFTSFTATAQDEAVEATEEAPEAPLQFSGSIDTYYRTTLNTDDNGPSKAPGTSFANETGFNIGMINLVASKEGEKAGFVADLVFGPRGDDAVFGAVLDNDKIVNQLYAYWNVSDKLTLTVGNFNTFLGYEVISPTANFNYSTSYAFSYGPFSHTGLKADFGITDELSAAVAVMNPTDATTTTSVNSVTLGAQLGYSKDNGGAWLNFLYGDQDGALAEVDTANIGSTSGASLFQVDLTTGWDVTDALYVGFNGTLNTVGETQIIVADGTDAKEDVIKDSKSTFLGAGLYLQYSLSDAFAIGFRGEYFQDNVNYGITGSYYDVTETDIDAIAARKGTDTGNIIDLTLSANYTVGGLTFIPEFRVDLASQDIYTDKDGKGTSALASFAVAAVYAF